ncbi:MAG: TRAP transporter small permease [Sneathiellaceae bacterium]
MRPILEQFYRLSGAAGALCFVLMGLLIVAQIVSRLLGVYIPSSDDIAAMFLAAGSFLALAYTLRHGGHIRVTLLLHRLPVSLHHPAELLCLATATFVTGWLAYESVWSVYYSWFLNDYTIGAWPIPKWIPQVWMAVGLVALFIAFLDDLVMALRGRAPSYAAYEHDPRSGAGEVPNE